MKIKTLLLTALLTIGIHAAELEKPRFPGDGSNSKVYVLKPFLDKTPRDILATFKRRVNFKEVDELGFDRWTFERDLKGKEDLATYKLIVVDNKWVLEGRRVFSLQLDFCRPIGTNNPWVCWDAVYVLSPKGVDPAK